eukprot:3452510-Amphidinium_carterae.1
MEIHRTHLPHLAWKLAQHFHARLALVNGMQDAAVQAADVKAGLEWYSRVVFIYTSFYYRKAEATSIRKQNYRVRRMHPVSAETLHRQHSLCLPTHWEIDIKASKGKRAPRLAARMPPPTLVSALAAAVVDVVETGRSHSSGVHMVAVQ